MSEKTTALYAKLDKMQKYREEEIASADELTKEKAKEIKNQTSRVLNEAIRKIEEAQSEPKGIDLEEFEDRIVSRFNDAFYYSIHKIDDLLRIKEEKNDIEDAINRFLNSEEFKKTSAKAQAFANEIYHQVEDYMNKEETKQAIKKAKITTVKIAEKGLESLKKLLGEEEVK